MINKRLNYINRLISRIEKWDNDTKLFSGGCAFAAYVITSVLKRYKIHYRLIVCDDILIYDDYDDILGGTNPCGHLAVQVRIGNSWEFVGRFINYGYIYKNLGEVVPEKILDYYNTVKSYDGWCHLYNTSNNGKFESDIMNIGYENA